MDQGLAVGERELAGGEAGRQHGRRRMAQQGEVGVVEIERVGGGAVAERGPDGAGAPPGADDRAER